MRRALAVCWFLGWIPVPAAAALFTVRLPPDGLVVEVPYTAGTHHEHVTAVDGTLDLDPERLTLERGRLVVPLSAFRSDDAQRGCHLREAMGLDYSRSRFPREHVCDDQNRLPDSGPDAVAYPDIVLARLRGAARAPSPGGAGEVEVEGDLTVHGVTRPIRFRLSVSPEPSGAGSLRVRGRVPLRLSEFAIQVKPAHVLFVSISVRDEVTVVVDALVEPVAHR